MPVPPRFYRVFCVYGRSPKNLIASVALRSARAPEAFAGLSNAAVLDEVWTHRLHRGQGLARGLLNLALESASRHGWTVYCRPIAHDGGPGPNQLELEAFYASAGFHPARVHGEDCMIWLPAHGHRRAA